MIPDISLTPEEKREWVLAIDAGLTPSEFIANTRRRLLNERIDEINSADTGLTAFIDDDGDLAYELTNLLKHFVYVSSGLQSSGIVRPDITPETIAAQIEASALSEKADRRVILDIADLMKRPLLADHPRLVGVAVDIIPAGQVNAWAQPIPSGGDAIGLNSQFSACSVWCDWFIQEWVESPQSPFYGMSLQKVQTYPVPQQSMIRETKELAAAIMGRLHNSEVVIEQYAQRLKSNRAGSRGAVYSQMLTAIAILHELGHIALQHTDWVRTLIEDELQGRPLRFSRSTLRARQRDNEYDADEFAARALVAMRAGDATRQGLRFKGHVIGWSALMLFALLEYSAPSDDPFGDDDITSTHPDPLNRIHAFLGHMGIDELGPFRQSLREMCMDAIDRIFGFLGVSRLTRKTQ